MQQFNDFLVLCVCLQASCFHASGEAPTGCRILLSTCTLESHSVECMHPWVAFCWVHAPLTRILLSACTLESHSVECMHPWLAFCWVHEPLRPYQISDARFYWVCKPFCWVQKSLWTLVQSSSWLICVCVFGIKNAVIILSRFKLKPHLMQWSGKAIKL